MIAIAGTGAVGGTTAEEFRVGARAVHLDELSGLAEPLDIVLLAVKSYDTEWMARALLPYLAADACVV